MRVPPAAGLAVALAASGCVYTHTLGPASYTTVNRIAERAPAEVTLRSGATGTALALHIASDSATWTEPYVPDRHMIATSEVLRVEFHRRAQGAGEGFFLGAGAGVVVGAALGALAYSPEADTGFIRFGRGFHATIGAGLLGIVGGLVGSGVGASRGSRDVFRISSATGAASTNAMDTLWTRRRRGDSTDLQAVPAVSASWWP